MEGYIDTLKAEAVELLKDMVAIPSLSFSEDAVCTFVSGWLSDKGVQHERIGNNIIAEHITDKGRPVLMLCAHMDTVPPSPEYSFDPYKPDYEAAAKEVEEKMKVEAAAKEGEKGYMKVRAEDIVAGLGSNDDGASVVAMIAAYRYFSGQDVNIVLVLTCEEERSGQGGMTAMWPLLQERYGEGIYAIVGEPTGMKAATSERGLLVIDAQAHGVSGHAARNEGVNAIYIALEDIGKLLDHKFAKVSPRMGNVNLNVTQINAGTAHNVVPDSCTFVIDIRPTEQYTNEEILNELQGICRSTLKPRNLKNRSSASGEHSPLTQTAERLGIESFSSPTTSDWMRITCDAIKMGPGDSSRSHRKDEFVFTEEIEEAIETYIRFIHEYALE